nr:hypothetical protein [Mesorhizobium sp. BH1-1-5]
MRDIIRAACGAPVPTSSALLKRMPWTVAAGTSPSNLCTVVLAAAVPDDRRDFRTFDADVAQQMVRQLVQPDAIPAEADHPCKHARAGAAYFDGCREETPVNWLTGDGFIPMRRVGMIIFPFV